MLLLPTVCHQQHTHTVLKVMLIKQNGLYIWNQINNRLGSLIFINNLIWISPNCFFFFSSKPLLLFICISCSKVTNQRAVKATKQLICSCIQILTNSPPLYLPAWLLCHMEELAYGGVNPFWVLLSGLSLWCQPVCPTPSWCLLVMWALAPH